MPCIVIKNFKIRHTRIKMDTNIIQTAQDIFNPLSVVITFEHERVSGYFLSKSEIPYAVYVDRQFYKEFFQTEVKVQMSDFDVISLVEIFALPHLGFRVDRLRLIPGNRLKIRFTGRKPQFFDIEKHLIFYDNTTGSFEASPIGVIDARTGSGGGRLLESARIVGVED